MNIDALLTGNSRAHLTACGNHWLHRDVVADFTAMQQAARRDGIRLTIASSFRDFNRQLTIWNNKASGKQPIWLKDGRQFPLQGATDEALVHAILQFSALPGASRHHWGTDLDLYDAATLPAGSTLRLSYEEYHQGHQRHLSQWLQRHAGRFGFFLPYRRDSGGVAPEPWHISHRRIASALLRQHSPERLKRCIENCDIIAKDAILRLLPELFSRYVCTICED